MTTPLCRHEEDCGAGQVMEMAAQMFTTIEGHFIVGEAVVNSVVQLNAGVVILGNRVMISAY